MKSKKIIALLLIIALTTIVLSITVSARWINAMYVGCELDFSGRTACCTGDIDAYSGSTITGTLTLYKKNGSSWDSVTSWNKNSSTTWLTFGENYTVNSAGTYKVVLTGTVTRNSTTEKISKTSDEKTCT